MRKFCRVVFSKYMICAITIAADIAVLWALLTYLSGYSFVYFLITAACDVCLILALVSRDANPEFKVSWLAVFLFLPLLGGALYVIFYSRTLSKKDAARLEGAYHDLKRIGSDPSSSLDELAKESSIAAGVAAAILKDDYLAAVYGNTRVKYYPSGEEMYADMLSDLRQAKEFIFLEYFIIEQGKMWDGIYEILEEKVRQGVDVRLIYDDFGCMRTLPAGFDALMRKKGISCYRFGKITPRLSAVNNNRDHRKITVIDGRIAYTGGVNIADEYINEKIRFGHWKDGGVRVLGEAAKGFLGLFLSSYALACKKMEDYSAFFSRTSDCIGNDGYYIPFGDGPAPVSPEYTSKNVFLNTINRADKYLYITTPYLIVDYDLTSALCNAAKRGVDVRIITPGIADKKLVKLMTKSAYPTLIRAGVRIFEYTPGFIHEKVLVCDDLFSVVGTVNMDYRSLVHHFEDALWMYRSSAIADIREHFLSTVSLCTVIDENTSKLKMHERLIRALVRIFAPLL